MPHSRRDPLLALNEASRLRALMQTGLMNSPPEAVLDRFTRLAANFLKAPTALISLVDDQRQFFKSAFGIAEPWASRRETPLTHSFCKHVVTTGAPLLVTDARDHVTLRANRAVEELDVIAYAGVPLITSEQQAIGALCVADAQPRTWSDDQIAVLRDLAEGVMHEVELRAASRDLLEANAQYRAMFDGVDTGILLSDAVRRVTWANSSAEFILGYAPGELTGARLFDLSDVEDREADRELHSQLVEGLRSRVTLRKRLKKKDGSWLWVRLTMSTLRDSQRNRVLVLGAFEDLTAAKQLELQLHESHDRYRALVDNLPGCSLLTFDRDLRYLVAEGEPVLRLAGLTCAGIIGKTVTELVEHTAHGKRLEQAYRNALRGENSVVEVRFNDQWFRCHVGPMRAQGKVGLGGLAVVFCSSEAHRLNGQLQLQTCALQIIMHLASDETSGASYRTLLKYILEALCSELDYALAHVFARRDEVLVSTGLWHGDQIRFGPFMHATQGLEYALDESLLGTAFSLERAASCDDVANVPTFSRQAAAQRCGLHGSLVFPVWFRGQVVAAIECYSTRIESENAGLLDIMTQLGRVMGRVLERERLRPSLEELTQPVPF